LAVVALACAVVAVVALLGSGSSGRAQPQAVGSDVYVFQESIVNFTAMGKISLDGGESLIGDVERSADDPHEGTYALVTRIGLDAASLSWGGWMFLHGDCTSGVCVVDWGDQDTGYDLSGATALKFWAKGAVGGERVEFFTAGLGWDEGGRTTKPHPDSSNKISLGVVTLSDSYSEYTIDLAGQDLTSIANGFGFVAASDQNADVAEVTVWLDDIRFELPGAAEKFAAAAGEGGAPTTTAWVTLGAAVIAGVASVAAAFVGRKR
jgi:hypothetical protein